MKIIDRWRSRIITLCFLNVTHNRRRSSLFIMIKVKLIKTPSLNSRKRRSIFLFTNIP